MKLFIQYIKITSFLSLILLIVFQPVSSRAFNDLKSIQHIAIFPYLSPQKLIKLYQPLTQYLSEKLGHKVQIISAPSYAEFMHRISNKDYSFLINASHMARMAQLDSDYHPFLRPINNLNAVMVVSNKSQLESINLLKNKVVAVPSRIAQISIMAEAMLNQAELQPGKNLIMRHHPTHGSAVKAVINGLADAAIVSSRALIQIKKRLGNKIKIIASSTDLKGDIPGIAAPIIYMLNPDISIQSQLKLQQLILDFVNNTVTGKKFVDSFGYGGLRTISEDEMKQLDPFIPSLRKALSH